MNTPSLLCAAVMAAAVSACATGASLDTAIILSNTVKHVLDAADTVVNPIYTASAAEARAAAGPDDAAYKRLMTRCDAVVSALTEIKQAAQVYWVAVDQWQQSADDQASGLTAEAAACLALAADHLGAAVVSFPGGPMLYGVLGTLSGQLKPVSTERACTGPHP